MICDDASYSPKDKKGGSSHKSLIIKVRSVLLRRPAGVLLFTAVTALLWFRQTNTLGGTTTLRSSSREATESAISTLPRLLDAEGHELSLEQKTTLVKGKRTALYFAAGWCPMCRRFEAPLMEFLKEQDSTKIQLIYVPSDRDAKSAAERAAKFGMPMVPWGQDADQLKQRYHIWSGKETPNFGRGRRAGVPSIVVLNGRTGEELKFLPTEAKGAKALQDWPLNDQENGIW